MFVVTARVIHGLRRGRNLGFPTANVRHRIGQAPPDGIYAAWACIDRQWYRAAVSVGKNKTFGASHATIEAHVLHWNRSLYGRTITLVFVRWLRAMRRFNTDQALVHTMRMDIKRVNSFLVSRCGRSGIS
ncbi:riboflavin kinase [Candidatus Uhrbacteria bacterium]|nr:riboflavin kinase [Candidatus Uhrbacteria bacterium]